MGKKAIHNWLSRRDNNDVGQIKITVLTKDTTLRISTVRENFQQKYPFWALPKLGVMKNDYFFWTTSLTFSDTHFHIDSAIETNTKYGKKGRLFLDSLEVK